MENIIQILDEIENGNLDNVDYVEALACVEGCVGGSFNVINPYIAKNNIEYILKNAGDNFNIEDLDKFDEMYDSGIFKFKLKAEDNPIKLNMKEAIIKNEKIMEINALLPGLDCGSCGAPTCYAHAEDVFNNQSELYDCIVLRAKNK